MRHRLAVTVCLLLAASAAHGQTVCGYVATNPKPPASKDLYPAAIAEVDGKWTMKYLRQKGNQMYLEAANKKYPPIYPEEELKISAVVKAVIRKY